MSKKQKDCDFDDESCNCHNDSDEECNCNKDCTCDDTCTCEDCDCEKDCNCEETCDCESDCDCKNNSSNDNKQENNYLNDLLRVQAEFDNYRKRMQTALYDARQDGFIDAITRFIPAIDSFKMATEYITDKNTLMGIKYIEKGILDNLSKMGVETIDTSGKFNPELHQAIDTDSSADVESGMIVKEVYKGFIYKGKVIRYSQVIVKK